MSVAAAPVVLGLEVAASEPVTMDKFSSIREAEERVTFGCASGISDRKLDGMAKYWNIKIDKFEMLNQGITDTDLEKLNDSYAKYFEARGWQVIDLGVFKNSPQHMCRFVRGVIHMDGEQNWARRVSQAIQDIKTGVWEAKSVQEKKRVLLGLYSDYDARWPNGLEFNDFPENLTLHDYYIGQMFKHDFW